MTEAEVDTDPPDAPGAQLPSGPATVSIVVLLQHRVDALARCLDSVQPELRRDALCEVVVGARHADVAALDGIQHRCPWARLSLVDADLGVAARVNRATEAVGGRYLALLADDAQVEPGWLSALLDVAEADPGVAAVGSRVVSHDGTLLEAGGVVWRDGSTTAVGRGLDDASQAYLYVRSVDYCSPASLLIRREAWEAVGGMDEQYHPAATAEVDLCLALRARGGRVVYQPASRVRRLADQVVADPDYNALVEREGRRRLLRRWAPILAGHEAAPDAGPATGAVDRAILRARGLVHRLLLIDDRYPDPGLGSGLPRMLTVAEQLGCFGALSFFPTAGWNGDRRRLGRLGVDVVAEPLDVHLARPDVTYDAVVISRPHNYQRFGGIVRRLQPQAAVVYDAEALFHRRMFLQAAVTGDAEVAAAATTMRTVESRIAGDVDHVVCVSDDEAKLLAEIPGHAPITVIPPRGIEAALTAGGFAARRDILLAAAWLHTGPDSPNLDGLLWFAAKVLPRVCALIPWTRLLVTGGTPPPAICALAGPNLRLLGHVEHLASVYARARVVVVPVRFGSGVKNKTVEALLHGVPTVSTSIGAEGLGALTAGALVVADEPSALAAALVRLLTDPDAWQVQRAAIETLLHEWESTTPPRWGGIIRDVLDERGRRSASRR